MMQARQKHMNFGVMTGRKASILRKSILLLWTSMVRELLWRLTPKDLSVTTVDGALHQDLRASIGAVHGSVEQQVQIAGLVKDIIFKDDNR